jgi:hypothetical protein
MTRAPAGKEESPGASTTPAPFQRSLAPVAFAALVGLFGWRTAGGERALAAVSPPVC